MTKEVYEQALQHEKELYKASVKLGTHVKSVARDVRQLLSYHTGFALCNSFWHQTSTRVSIIYLQDCL